MSDWTTLLEGLHFPEGPRWRDGRLHFSDFYQHRVLAVDTQGRTETIVEVPGQPSGLGWLPDGRLLCVSMTDRRVMRQEGDELVEHADLSSIAAWHCNDMVVDGTGRAWVGNFGFDSEAGGDVQPAVLARVDPDGTAHPAAADMLFPNGSVVTPDGKTLIVAETWGGRLTAFDIGSAGDLSGRREWANLAPHIPDGICLDAEGAIWVADPVNSAVVRVREGGEVTDRLSTGSLGAYACMLGGPERRTLFALINSASGPEAAARTDGRIVTRDVDVPGAGFPGDE